MLRKLIGLRSRVDHPLADPKELKRILGELASMEAYAAVDEINHWFESIAATEISRTEQHFQLVREFDEAAQSHLRKLAVAYLANTRVSKNEETRLWTAIHAFWKNTADAYMQCVRACKLDPKNADMKAHLPLLCVCTLRAQAAQVKWLKMRYEALEPDIWRNIGRVYRFAESRKISTVSVSAYSDVPEDSTVQQECLKALMFSVSSLECLLRQEIDIAERLIACFLPHFVLTQEFQPDSIFRINFAGDKPPSRLRHIPETMTNRMFFTAAAAVDTVNTLIEEVAGGSIPAELKCVSMYPREKVLAVLQHFALYWAPKPPSRAQPRHAVNNRADVVHGFADVSGCVDPDDGFMPPITESCVLENISAGGFSAQMENDALKIGSLLGIRPDGGEKWFIGMVCRLSRDTEKQLSVGIQILARNAGTIWAAPQGGRPIQAVQLVDAEAAPGEVVLMFEGGTLKHGLSFTISHSGRNYMLMPAGALAQNDDYDIGKFKAFIRQ
jgi:hypothetical protein